MKKVPVIIFLLLSLTACDFLNSHPLSLEMVAYNSLTDEETARIPVSPKDARVELIEVNDKINEYLNPEYENNKVYSITFKHTETELTGNLIVFIALDKKTVVGKGNASN
ncbi:MULTISPECIES: hypothetical protein [Bacillus]|uniref:hypothetical protein n=1 Tax=Bacillus TaxID=1386 RepID=UPI000BB6AA0B|nr:MULTISPECIES: hypothetical protein [Bacillus]